MKVSSARKATGMAAAAIAILALAAGSAFAGTGGSNGDNRLNNTGTNNKTGTWHKQDRSCPTDYDWTQAYPGYDLNGDTYECIKYNGDGTIFNIVDDTSN